MLEFRRPYRRLSLLIGGGHRNPRHLGSWIEFEPQRLSVAAHAVAKDDRERISSEHRGFSLPQQLSCPCWMTGHEGVAMCVQHPDTVLFHGSYLLLSSIEGYVGLAQ
jgi:hypothetical protein